MSETLLPTGLTRAQARSAPQVQLETEGRMAGNVLVLKQDDVLLIDFTVAHGHLPAAIRRDLVERAFRLPEFNLTHQRVLVVIPLGDVDLLQDLQARLCDARTRAAGATCLIEATIR